MKDKKPAAPQSSPLPWTLMDGCPWNVLSGGVRVARCDFDGDTNHPETRINAALIVRRVNQGPAFEAMLPIIEELAAYPCENAPGEFPKTAEGESGHAPCPSCRARAALKLAQEVR